jgi:hypothetical protein
LPTVSHIHHETIFSTPYLNSFNYARVDEFLIVLVEILSGASVTIRVGAENALDGALVAAPTRM